MINADTIIKLVKKVDKLEQYPKVLTTAGIIANGATDKNVQCRGFATVILNSNGIAEVQYEYKLVASADSSLRVWDWGLNRDLLHSINNDIPIITPIQGGTCLMYNNSSIDYDKQGMGGTNLVYNQFWVPARVWTDTNDLGWWESRVFTTSSHIRGTAYGTFEV